MDSLTQPILATPRPARRFWYFLFAAHALAAAAWWWIMPGGFPASSPRCWMNAGMPALFVVVAMAGIAASGLRRNAIVLLAAAFFAAFWFAGAAMLFVLFFASRVAAPSLLGGLIGLVIWLRIRRARRGIDKAGADKLPTALQLCATICGAAVGSFAIWAQRAPEPDTRPAATSLPADLEVVGNKPLSNPPTARVGERPTVDVNSALVTYHGALTLDITPLLTFESRSPDRCWTVLAPQADRVGPPRRLVAMQRSADALTLQYRCDGREFLRVASPSGRIALEIVAQCELPHDVYSHLNSLTDITVSGQRELALAFSPCPAALIAVTASDYPVGRPRRFAYLDAHGTFHVAEATSGEKGPFRDLASGPLARTDRMTIGLYDGQTLKCRVTLADWAAQAGTQLSPTAGWGVPVNAIEFTRNGDLPGASASIWISLAATSIGRGWDSVGHRAGIYRNRIVIEEAESEHKK